MQIIGFFVQGCTGFGCTVIAAAVTNGLLGTTEGVPYGTLITLPFMYFLGIKAFKDVSWKDLAKIICLCMPGILVGNYLFHAVSPDVAKICIGAMVTFIFSRNVILYVELSLSVMVFQVLQNKHCILQLVQAYLYNLLDFSVLLSLSRNS